jgi:hypothetical protein
MSGRPRGQRSTLLDEENEKHAARAANNDRIGTLLNVFGCVTLAVSAVLLFILIFSTPREAAPIEFTCPLTTAALTADNTTCDRSTECLQGFVSGDNASCTYYPRPTNVTNCTSACYPNGPTACDGKGACVGNAAACVGTCYDGSDCPSSFYNEDIRFNADDETEWDFSGWYSPFGCFLGSCVYVVVDIYAVSNKFPILYNDGANLTLGWFPGAARLQCLDYVHPDVRSEYADCLTTDRQLLTPDIIADYGEYGGFLDYTNASFPFQLSACVMSYSCAKMTDDYIDTNGFIESSGNASSSNASAPIAFKTASQWGFQALESTRSVGSAAFGIADPALRNIFYAHLHDHIGAQLPAFIARVMNNGTSPVPVDQ